MGKIIGESITFDDVTKQITFDRKRKNAKGYYTTYNQ